MALNRCQKPNAQKESDPSRSIRNTARSLNPSLPTKMTIGTPRKDKIAANTCFPNGPKPLQNPDVFMMIFSFFMIFDSSFDAMI